MPEQSIRVTVEGGCTTILIDKPRAMNALDTPMHHQLERAFDDFAADERQRICVVRGAGGRAFCAGSDLKFLARMKAEGREDELAYPPHGYAGLTRRFDLDKPIIAAVDGIAFGGGFEIVLACDIVLATTRSRFALPEPKVGAVALGGGAHRLARQVGLKKAMGMILTGEAVSADEGHAAGFVNEVVEPDALDATIARWVNLILGCGPGAIEASKQMVMRGLDEPSLQSALDGQGQYPAYAKWAGSDEPWEGARAFAEKRQPAWSNSPD